MIQWEENNLAYLASEDFIGNNEVLFSFFKEKEGFFPDSSLAKLQRLAERVDVNMTRYKDKT